MSNFDFTDAVKGTVAEQHDKIAELEVKNDNLRTSAKALLDSITTACDNGTMNIADEVWPRILELASEVSA